MTQRVGSMNVGCVVLISLVAAFGEFLFGYDTAVVSRAIGYLKANVEDSANWEDPYVLALGLKLLADGGEGGSQLATRVADRLHELRTEDNVKAYREWKVSGDTVPSAGGGSGTSSTSGLPATSRRASPSGGGGRRTRGAGRVAERPQDPPGRPDRDRGRPPRSVAPHGTGCTCTVTDIVPSPTSTAAGVTPAPSSWTPAPAPTI